MTGPAPAAGGAGRPTGRKAKGLHENKRQKRWVRVVCLAIAALLLLSVVASLALQLSYMLG